MALKLLCWDRLANRRFGQSYFYDKITGPIINHSCPQSKSVIGVYGIGLALTSLCRKEICGNAGIGCNRLSLKEELMRGDIVPGANFPDYELLDHTGVRRRLSEVQGKGPALLMLARGSYCPRDNRQLRWMVDMEPEVDLGYCRFITLSTDPVITSKEWRAALGAHWTFLSDEERTVQSDLDIAEYTDPTHNVMVPHTVMLEPGLVVHKVYVGYWYWGRPTPEEVRQDFRAMSMKQHPDWDITEPGLRERWERGDRHSFFPYR
jgi:peroxiredoxin